jgi:hypothetical protein
MSYVGMQDMTICIYKLLEMIHINMLIAMKDMGTSVEHLPRYHKGHWWLLWEHYHVFATYVQALMECVW